MLKLLAENPILGLAQGPAHTGIGICSFATGELPIIMDVFNKLSLLDLNTEPQFVE